jgi:hypothetical protein
MAPPTAHYGSTLYGTTHCSLWQYSLWHHPLPTMAILSTARVRSSLCLATRHTNRRGARRGLARPAVCMCMCACVHVCMCACVHVCVCACMHVCMCACVHVCMCACVHVCTCACVHACMRACVHVHDVCVPLTHICTCAPSCSPWFALQAKYSLGVICLLQYYLTTILSHYNTILLRHYLTTTLSYYDTISLQYHLAWQVRCGALLGRQHVGSG